MKLFVYVPKTNKNVWIFLKQCTLEKKSKNKVSNMEDKQNQSQTGLEKCNKQYYLKLAAKALGAADPSPLRSIAVRLSLLYFVILFRRHPSMSLQSFGFGSRYNFVSLNNELLVLLLFHIFISIQKDYFGPLEGLTALPVGKQIENVMNK